MADAPSLELLGRWREHADQRAAEELFHRYAGRLIALARSRMPSRLGRRVDPDDVVQSAVRSFFVRVRDGRLIVQPDSELWQLLAAITMHKLFSQVEHHTAGKRSVAREQETPSGESVCIVPVEAVANDPTPDDAAALREELEKALSPLKPKHRQMVELRLEGHTQPEIAEKTGYTERMVGEVLRKFGVRLKEQLAKE